MNSSIKYVLYTIMVCTSSKSLQNVKNCITGLGSNGQAVVNDGASGLKYSTSLIRSTPAVLAAVLTQNLSIPSNVVTQLVTPNIALDVQTNQYAASIFNVFGQNISGQPIWVHVSYSIAWSGALQVIDNCGCKPTTLLKGMGMFQTPGQTPGIF